MKSLILTTVFLAFGSAQASAYECWVVGQSKQDSNNYTELLQHSPDLDLQPSNQPALLLSTETVAVIAAVNPDAKLTVTTVSQPQSKLSAIAVGGSDQVQLIDASLKIAIMCKSQ